MNKLALTLKRISFASSKTAVSLSSPKAPSTPVTREKPVLSDGLETQSTKPFYQYPMQSHWSLDTEVSPSLKESMCTKAKDIGYSIKTNTRGAAKMALAPSVIAFVPQKKVINVDDKNALRIAQAMQGINALTLCTAPLAMTAAGLLVSPVVGLAAGLAGATPRQRWLRPEHRASSLLQFVSNENPHRSFSVGARRG